MDRVEKPWGWEELLEVNERYVLKRIFLARWERTSLQYHERKVETVFVLEGQLVVELGEDEEVTLWPREFLTIKAGDRHRMTAKMGDALYLEASSPELEDVVRVEDDYGRGGCGFRG